MLRLFYILIAIFFILGKCQAQKQHYTFYNLSEKEGLRNNIIFCLFNDSHGMMWIGTQNGLNRFDGSHFYNYKKSRNTTSIPNNTINSLCEDKKGNIWGGTANGIFSYSGLQHRFKQYNAPKNAFDNSIYYITCDRQGTIYACTSIDILKYNEKNDQFELLIKLTEHEDSISSFLLGKNRILWDEKSHGFWMALPIGLGFYDLSSKKLIGFFNGSQNELFSKRNVSALAKSPLGYLWFFDNQNKEVIAFDPVLKKYLRRISIKQKFPDAKGATLFEDSRRHLWFSSWSYDVLNIDLNHPDEIITLESKEENNYTISANFFWAVAEDENTSIWLGTINGLSICTPGKYLFKANQLQDKISALSGTAISLIEENVADQSWWLILNNSKVIHYFPTSEKYALFDLHNAIPDKNGAQPNFVYKILLLNDIPTLVTSAGAWQLKPHAKTFSPFNPLPGEYNDFIIRSIVQKDSILYLTDGDKLLKWNSISRKGEWIKYSSIDSIEKGPLQFYWMMSKPGQPIVWMCNNTHIAYLDQNNQIHVIKLIANEKFEAGGFFQTIEIDVEGNIWVANKGVGLYRYNIKTQQIKYWTDLDGLVDNHLHSIKADTLGNIWAIYFNKVSVFNPKASTFINFNIPYSENNYNYSNHLVKKADGSIMGNVRNDIFQFYPENLMIKPVIKSPHLNVTGISGKELIVDSENTITLPPDQNTLRFKFGILLDAFIYSHRFHYKLEGIDKDWIQASTGNEVGYNNLAPGKYIFRLVAKGVNNAWKSKETSIQIVILTPFYKTKVFLAFILLAIASGIFYLYRYRLMQKESLFALESKAQLLEKEKTIMMYDSLKQQLNPHFLFNSLSSLSGLIVTDQQMAGEFLDQMSGIYRYILKNGDHETVNLKDELEFVKLYINLQKTRFKEGLIVHLDVSHEYFHFKIAPVTLQNLIENAIKHNVIDIDSPLVIDLFVQDDYIIVKNNLQKKNRVETSNKKGLEQFKTLYQYLSLKSIIVEESDTYFIIKIPLIE